LMTGVSLMAAAYAACRATCTVACVAGYIQYE
jgi:hypothetical protein